MNKKLNQAGKPSGLIGRLLGIAMTRMNHIDNIWTIGLLNIADNDRLLEIGYGPGQAIQLISDNYPNSRIYGIDHSTEMLSSATRANRDGIVAGKVRLEIGDVAQLEFRDNIFNKIYSINCIYFWEDTLKGLEELHRVLKPGGRLAITVRERSRQAYEPFQPRKIERLMKLAGFVDIQVQHNGVTAHPLYCILANK